MSRYIDAELADKLLTEGYSIDEVPTADVEEVRHGKYINDQGTQLSLCTAECSCCNKITATGLYCMWCGAKMDKEKENDRT